jgi:hypothetical protein
MSLALICPRVEPVHATNAQTKARDFIPSGFYSKRAQYRQLNFNGEDGLGNQRDLIYTGGKETSRTALSMPHLAGWTLYSTFSPFNGLVRKTFLICVDTVISTTKTRIPRAMAVPEKLIGM